MPTVQVLAYRSGSTLPHLMPRIAAGHAAGHRILVIVPEQYTLQAERELMDGLKTEGLLDIDVFSPRRLKQMIRERAGSTPLPSMDAVGRVMACSQVLSDVRDQIRYYGSALQQPGLAGRMADILTDLEETGYGPEWLLAQAEHAIGQLTREKEHDIATVWGGFLELAAGHFCSEEDANRDAIDRLPDSGLLEGTDVFVCGFDVISSPLARMLAAMVKLASSVSVALTLCLPSAKDRRAFRGQQLTLENLRTIMDMSSVETRTVYESVPPCEVPELAWMERNIFSPYNSVWDKPCPALRLHSAPNSYEEALFAAGQLRMWHESGIPWSRMSVVLGEMETLPGLVPTILRAAEIPCYLSTKDFAVRHGLCQMLTAAAKAISTGWEQRYVLACLDSGFSGLSDAEACRLRDYALENGIRWKKWTVPFTRGSDAAEMEPLRERLMEPLIDFRDHLRSARDGSVCSEAIWIFLERIGAYQRLLEREDLLLRRNLQVAAAQNRQIWRILMDLIDQMHALLKGRKIKLKDFARLIEAGLLASTIGGLPPTKDVVMVGEAGHLLTGEMDAVLVMGMQDGVMSSPSRSLLTDEERLSLDAHVGMTTSMQNDLRRSDFYRTLTQARKKLTMSCSMSSMAGMANSPAALFGDLRRAFPQIRVTGGVLQNAAEGNLPLSPQLAMEQLPVRLREGRMDEAWWEAYRRLESDERWRQLRDGETQPIQRIKSAHARAIFQQRMVSISRLESFAACPRQHYFRYGLVPRQPRAFRFERDEVGVFYHAVMCRYANLASAAENWPNLSDEQMDRLLDEALAPERETWENGPLREDAVGRALGDEYIQTVRKAAWMFTRHAQHTGFSRISTEVRFGDEGGLPSVILELSDGHQVALRGIIDRIDRWQGDRGLFLRVVDYKSREQKLEPVRMYWGLQLQLLLYLAAAMEGEHGEPAGAFYFKVTDPRVKSDDDIREEAEKLLARELRLSGISLAETEVIEAHNGGSDGYVMPNPLKKDGTPKKGELAVGMGDMLHLIRRQRQISALLTQRLMSGDISMRPGQIKDWIACDKCDFKDICRHEQAEVRDLQMDSQEAFARMISEEAEDPLGKK